MGCECHCLSHNAIVELLGKCLSFVVIVIYNSAVNISEYKWPAFLSIS